MKDYPLLFDNLVEPQFPDDLDAPITYDPDQWLQAIVERADRAIEAWESDWPVSSRHYCRNARESAQKALQALSDDNVGEAMLSAFRAGMFIEKAQRDFPIEDWLQRLQKQSIKNKRGGKANADAAKMRVAAIREWVDIYLDQRLSSITPSASDLATRALSHESSLRWPGTQVSHSTARKIISAYLKELNTAD